MEAMSSGRPKRDLMAMLRLTRSFAFSGIVASSFSWSIKPGCTTFARIS